jgi:release factor glutamine methyltransferase
LAEKLTVKELIRASAESLRCVSSTPKLDAQCLLVHVLVKARSWLYAHPEYIATDHERDKFEELIKRRLQGESVAYCVGSKSFYKLDLMVNHAVLVPRPETECLVEAVLLNHNETMKEVLDLGTGSGAIALALATERLKWRVTAVDQSQAALAVAKQNAVNNSCENVTFIQSSWFSAVQGPFDVIVSNPPYIAEDDSHLDALTHEPRTALVAPDNGLGDIKHILQHAQSFLKPGGCLYIEHGHQQADEIVNYAASQGYIEIKSHRDLSGQPRFISCQRPV